MLWRKKPDLIRVQFFDAATGKQFGWAEMPAEQLPESFEAATTMHLGDEDWQVVRAEPVTAADFRRTGRLRLFLTRVQIGMVDPREILYTLPTISNELPAITPGSTKLGKQVLELHEDDWRQIELVALVLQESIDGELQAIRAIYERHRTGIGFDALHVREQVPSPLAGVRITPDDLKTALGTGAAWLDGIAFRGIAGIVADGFALRLPGAPAFYGLSPGGQVAVLGLAGDHRSGASDAMVDSLSDFAVANDLCLVDWCRCRQVLPAAGAFRQYFAPTAR